MAMFQALNISATGMSAQRLRMDPLINYQVPISNAFNAIAFVALKAVREKYRKE